MGLCPFPHGQDSPQNNTRQTRESGFYCAMKVKSFERTDTRNENTAAAARENGKKGGRPHHAIPVDEVMRRLDYNAETGEFTNKITNNTRAKSGQIAGTKLINGYIKIQVEGRPLLAHRIAWTLIYGQIPQGMTIDHINHNPSDNRICNLRLVKHSDNCKNLSRRSDNTSGVTGVSLRSDTKKWSAVVYDNGDAIRLGCFENIHSAAEAVRQKRAELGFHENHGK